MSSSSYSQGLQSCLEPARLVESCVLRLKLATNKSNSPRCSTNRKPSVTYSDCDPKSNKNADVGGWSFLQSLANNTSQSTTKETTDERDKIYIPPNFKRSSSMLSAKSLEMCTESLGSETGSDSSESSDEMALLSVENVQYETRERSKLRGTRRMNRSASFPPPLTSISGSTNVQVKPHREDGRLVLKAVAVSSCQSYFHAERTNGRLRLHLTKDYSPDNYDNEKDQEEEEAEAEAEYGEEVVEAEDGEDIGADDDIWGEEMEGNRENGGGEMGMGALVRLESCKEAGNENNGLLTREQFWVAT